MQSLKSSFKKFRVCVLVLFVALLEMTCVQFVDADITITQRESAGRLRVFTGSGGAANIDDVQDSTEALSGMFMFDESFKSDVTEEDPFSNGAATASGSVDILDDVIQSMPSSLTLNTFRTSNASVQYMSGSGNATSGPRHTFRVRFSVSDQAVRYTLTGSFTPGPIENGATRLELYRPFTANSFFEYDTPQSLNETGVLQPGLTYELLIQVNDLLAASGNNPGPSNESTGYNLQFHVENVLIGDVNLDGVINLLDVEPFIDAISNGVYQIEADIDGNGEVNLLDVDPFIDLISGG